MKQSQPKKLNIDDMVETDDFKSNENNELSALPLSADSPISPVSESDSYMPNEFDNRSNETSENESALGESSDSEASVNLSNASGSEFDENIDDGGPNINDINQPAQPPVGNLIIQEQNKNLGKMAGLFQPLMEFRRGREGERDRCARHFYQT